MYKYIKRVKAYHTFIFVYLFIFVYIERKQNTVQRQPKKKCHASYGSPAQCE